MARPTDPDCIFCRIVAGSIPCMKVYEDEHVLAFLDIQPLADGHTMVIPKAHHQRLEELPAESHGPMLAALARVSGAVREAMDAPSTTVGLNNGREAGQVVPHVHFHLVPRFADDGGGSIHSIVRSATGAELEPIRARIASAVGSTE